MESAGLLSPRVNGLPRPAATPPAASGGWCRRCGRTHLLAPDDAWGECARLMAQLQGCGRIDLETAAPDADPRCATGPLFAPGGGKMFGVLCCRDRHGRRVVLRAFSGQYGGRWQVPGWVGPVHDPAVFDALTGAADPEIKRLGAAIARAPAGSASRRDLVRRRRALSRDLMERLHDLYHLVNFRGERRALVEVFHGPGRPPSGTGDCCGPKLLQHAATNGLVPESMAEFFWGESGASAARMHAGGYPACAAKCQPILGFMLCGLEGG